MVSRCWGFSITDANLNDIENAGYAFSESNESYLWFKYMECRTCSRKPVFKFFDVVRLRGIIIFSRPVNLEQVFLILGYRARVFKIDDSNVVATKTIWMLMSPNVPLCEYPQEIHLCGIITMADKVIAKALLLACRVKLPEGQHGRERIKQYLNSPMMLKELDTALFVVNHINKTHVYNVNWKDIVNRDDVLDYIVKYTDCMLD
ncbi:hypothetical protein ACF0H5_004566 [Mactra antiquata]